MICTCCKQFGPKLECFGAGIVDLEALGVGHNAEEQWCGNSGSDGDSQVWQELGDDFAGGTGLRDDEVLQGKLCVGGMMVDLDHAGTLECVAVFGV